MVHQITFIDETLSGEILQSWEVEAPAAVMTLRELIMLRVEEEIKREQDDRMRYFTRQQALLTAMEHQLNDPGRRRNVPGSKYEAPDAEAHGYRALDAFQRNAFFVLIGNKQVDDLEATIPLSDKQPVSFVRLTPLVGG